MACRSSDALGPVLAHGGTRVGVGGSFLDITKWHPDVQGRGGERMPQSMRPDGSGDPGAAVNPADDPICAVPVQPAPVNGAEDRPFAALNNRQINRPRGTWCERNRNDFAALAGNHQCPVARSMPMAGSASPWLRGETAAWLRRTGTFPVPLAEMPGEVAAAYGDWSLTVTGAERPGPTTTWGVGMTRPWCCSIQAGSPRYGRPWTSSPSSRPRPRRS